MISLVRLALTLTASVALVSSTPLKPSLDTRDKVIADGTSMQYGNIDEFGLQYQAAGVLKQGCGSSTSYPIHITSCYGLSLSSSPDENLDPGHLDSPRQRLEFLTPKFAAGTTQKLKWRYYLSSQTKTSSKFFHLFQLKDQKVSPPYVTLTAVNGKVTIDDNIRTGATFPSIALEDFTDKTTVHFLDITYGPSGKLKYVIKDAEDESKELLRYEATGSLGEDASFIKFGLYRSAFEGMSVAAAAVGDFSGL